MFEKKFKTILVLLIPVCSFFFPIYAGTSEVEVRALWVTRWDYSTPEDIYRIVQNAADFHFNTLLFQVRGNGTVFYPSKWEPWAEEFGWEDPGWNPLTTAIAAAHRHGLALHAWVNVFPGWRGEKPPENKHQLFHTHPRWFMADETGQPIPLNSHYVWLNPVLPDVQDYLLKVFLELARTLDLDGIHFDYFRFPGPGVSYDKYSLMLFKRKYGITPRDSIPLWVKFRREAISQFLEKFFLLAKQINPKLIISSAVIGDFDNGPNIFLQDSHRWLEKGIIDWIFPMTYTDDTHMLSRWLRRHAVFSHTGKIFPGLMLYEPITLEEEIHLLRKFHFAGFALFAYNRLFPQHEPSVLAHFVRDSLSIGSTSPKPVTSYSHRLSISDVYWFPRDPTSADSLRIMCKIETTDPSNSYQVFGLWQNRRNPSRSKRIRFHPLARNPSYWSASRKIPPQRPGDGYFVRVFAYRPERIPQTMVASDLYPVIIATPEEYFHSAGSFAPLFTQVTRAAADRNQRVWVYDPQAGGIRVFDSSGREIFPEPVRTFFNENGSLHSIEAVYDLQTLGNGEISALVRGHDTNFLIINSRRNDKFFTLFPLPDAGKSFAVTRGRFFFILNAGGWYVVNGRGEKLGEFRFSERHTSNNIAVTPEGRYVLIACRTEGKVHRWLGEVSEFSATYEQISDLALDNIGFGEVTCGESGTVYVASPPGGFVAVLNHRLELLELLKGGKPAVLAPRRVVPFPDAREILILQAGGTTPVRMLKWRKIRTFPSIDADPGN